MRLWGYFEQEAKKLKVPEVKKWNLKATPPFPSQLGLVFIPPRKDFRVRARIECHKKGGFFTSRKDTEAAHRSLLIVTASTGIHESIRCRQLQTM